MGVGGVGRMCGGVIDGDGCGMGMGVGMGMLLGLCIPIGIP